MGNQPSAEDGGVRVRRIENELQRLQLQGNPRNVRNAQPPANAPAPPDTTDRDADADSPNNGGTPALQQTTTIRNDVNLKKGSIALLPPEGNSEAVGRWRLRFAFDAACNCSASVYFKAQDATVESAIEGKAPDILDNVDENELGESERTGKSTDGVRFSKGIAQVCEQSMGDGVLVEKLLDLPDTANGQPLYHIVVRLEAIDDESRPDVQNFSCRSQSQTTYASVVKEGDAYSVSVTKQKIWVNDCSFELQDIYGIETAMGEAEGDEEEMDANSKECVICLAAARDTTVLPCRHMCMCAPCAKVLRYRTTACPICRCPIDSLLQIKVAPRDSASAPPDLASGSEAPVDGAESRVGQALRPSIGAQ
mmetsp:Transcript_3157/g.11396  ORF Transcript_3157/g.11396 Transcript_3157/m.11396 type:complete len:366 (-) Transcript_3157:120-1217(-)